METIKAKYASTQSELNNALDAGERVIVVQGNLYNEIKEVAEKSQKSKVAKSGGKPSRYCWLDCSVSIFGIWINCISWWGNKLYLRKEC